MLLRRSLKIDIELCYKVSFAQIENDLFSQMKLNLISCFGNIINQQEEL